jgi:hypothetical protein
MILFSLLHLIFFFDLISMLGSYGALRLRELSRSGLLHTFLITFVHSIAIVLKNK